MAVLSVLVVAAALFLAGFLVSALPLYFAVRFLGGKTSLIKTAAVAFVSGIIVTAIKNQFRFFGALIAFFILIWIYHEVFRLRWLKAFLAWMLQFIFLAIFYVVAALILAGILGISIFALLF